MKYILFIFLISSTFITHAQEQAEKNTNSKIRLIQDSRLEVLESNYKKIRRESSRPRQEIQSNQTIRGYRIQIYSGNDRAKASDIRIKFMGSYPNTPCYLQFLSPYYKIRVGDYENSQEASKKLKYFQRVYPSALVVPSYINN